MFLSSQQKAELEFWQSLVEQIGPEYYYAYRCAEYKDKTKHFPSFLAQEGTGIDLGCGCISVFEPSSKVVSFALDPLVAEYNALLGAYVDVLHLDYAPIVDENIGMASGCLDWVACLNMLDHTPNPAKMLGEIVRVLRPGGRLYFEVNFEVGLAPPHYYVFGQQSTDGYFQSWPLQKVHSYTEAVPEHHQHRYWAEYVRA